MEDIKEFIDMRQIKFRAKTLGDNNVWVFGDLHIRSAFAHIHTDLGTKSNIDTDTIGQFTGLYDKDGKEIYEGDIIKYTHEICIEDGSGTYVGAVSFCGGVFCLHEDSDCTVATVIYESDEYGGICVIGNIHDNPELLTNK